MTAPASSEPRPLRADAQRNLDRVVAAAAEVFAERGLEAGVPEVAARAGVGKATVYRSFPTKEHLVSAIVVQRLRRFEAEVDAALQEDDAWAAFRRVLVDGAERQAADRALAEGLAHAAELPELQAARASVALKMQGLMDRAKAQGSMRPDAAQADLRVLFAGMARVLTQDDVHDVSVWRRCAGLVVDAFRA